MNLFKSIKDYLLGDITPFLPDAKKRKDIFKGILLIIILLMLPPFAYLVYYYSCPLSAMFMLRLFVYIEFILLVTFGTLCLTCVLRRLSIIQYRWQKLAINLIFAFVVFVSTILFLHRSTGPHHEQFLHQRLVASQQMDRLKREWNSLSPSEKIAHHDEYRDRMYLIIKRMHDESMPVASYGPPPPPPGFYRN